VDFTSLPPFAAWRHRDARDCFEVVFVTAQNDGYDVNGHTAAVEDGEAWAVEYSITLDSSWATRNAVVTGRSATGHHRVELNADGAGSWRVNGDPVPLLDGCLDLDLESSSFTNTFPMHRLALGIGKDVEAPAAYVRAVDLRVERLEQQYRLPAHATTHRVYYRAPVFDVECELVFDESGLVLDYPGLATRIA